MIKYKITIFSSFPDFLKNMQEVSYSKFQIKNTNSLLLKRREIMSISKEEKWIESNSELESQSNSVRVSVAYASLMQTSLMTHLQTLRLHDGPDYSTRVDILITHSSLKLKFLYVQILIICMTVSHISWYTLFILYHAQLQT